MSNYHFILFKVHANSDSIRANVLEAVRALRNDLVGTLVWNDLSTKSMACGEVTLESAPFFSVGLAIHPDVYLESERTQLLERLTSNSSRSSIIRDCANSANAILLATPLVEESDDEIKKLFGTIGAFNQPAIIAVNCGETIYDSLGYLMYPKSLLPRNWTKLF